MARYWAIIGVAAVEDMRGRVARGSRGIKKVGGWDEIQKNPFSTSSGTAGILHGWSADILSAVGKGTFCPAVFFEGDYVAGQNVRRPTARKMHALRGARRHTRGF
jgi:hypothetical protein